MMHSFRMVAACGLAAALWGLSPPATAAVVAFNGSGMNTDALGPPSSRCGARFTVNIGNGPNASATGTSNFGPFTVTQSHCIQLPPPAAYDLGQFRFDFGPGDVLFGTYSGALTFNAPGVFGLVQNSVVTGGTGLFAGATGTFSGTGTVSFLGGAPSAQQRFTGTLNLPAVPEPATWMMMITGFGLAGLALRRRNAALGCAT